MGKGSRPRPLSISKEEFDKNWDLAFGKKKKDKNIGFVTTQPMKAETDFDFKMVDKNEEILKKWAPILEGGTDETRLQTALVLESEQKTMADDTLIHNLLYTLIYEINDKQTREEVVKATEKILSEQRCCSMPFTVKCDEENNPPDIVEAQKLVMDVYWDNGLEGKTDVWMVEPTTVDDLSGYKITKNGKEI